MQNSVQNTQQREYNFQENDLNKSVLNAQYAVRGRVPQRAQQIQQILNKIKNGEEVESTFPFDELTEANIGNPQTFGQPPISFFRQVISGVLNPELLELGAFKNQDVVNRINFFLKNIKGNIGAYTHSFGYEFVRKSIAEYIARRDDQPLDTDYLRLMTLDGASQGVHLALKAFITHSSDGVMIPIPQYPLYSAGIALNGGSEVHYYLDEENGWQVSMEELENQYKQAKKRGVTPKILCVINPGNPTGNILSEETISNMIKFAYDNKMIIIADEVYQVNIYNQTQKFHSFRKVLMNQAAPYNQGELLSVHSTSKGVIGECGLRGGYMEMVNLHPDIRAQLLKLKSINLCSNTVGQLMTEMMVNPPSIHNGASQETIDAYEKEFQGLFEGLVRRIKIVNDTLNSMDNIKSAGSDGAMYVFPQVFFSDKIKQIAKEKGMEPDLYYCLEVLENTGLVVVPGSGFGQKEGTYHFRITNLIRPEEKLENTLKRFQEFNKKFHA